MELVVVDGFDHYGNRDPIMDFWGPTPGDSLKTNVAIPSTLGPDGTRCISFDQYAGSSWARSMAKVIEEELADPNTIYGVSYHVRVPVDSFNNINRLFPSWGTTAVRSSIASGPSAGVGQLSIVGNSTSDVTLTAPGSFTPDAWYHVETHLEKGDSSSWRYTVRISGVTAAVVEVTAPTVFNRLNLLTNVGAGGVSFPLFDNVIFYKTPKSEDMWLGETNVATLVPNGDIVNDWVSSGPNAWSVLDNIPPVSGQQITSSSVGQEITVSLTDLPSADVSVKGVLVGYRASKTGTDLTQTTLDVPGSSESPDTLLQGSYKVFNKTLEVNPDTGVQWTPGDINNLEITIKRVT